MALSRVRMIAAWVCTVLSLPGMLLGVLWLMVLASRPGANEWGVALLLANAFAWIAYLVCANGWVAGRRVPRAWPIGGMLAAASYVLNPLTFGRPLGEGLGELVLGLILVLPATLLSGVLVPFHLGRERADAPALTPPAAPPAP